MRVLTQVRPVTENRVLAETAMNPAVIGKCPQAFIYCCHEVTCKYEQGSSSQILSYCRYVILINFFILILYAGTFATQQAAKLALEGDIDHAKEITNAHKNLLTRAMWVLYEFDIFLWNVVT